MSPQDEAYYAGLPEELLRISLPKFLNNDDWGIACGYAGELLRRFPEDFEVACALQHAAIEYAQGVARTVVLKSAELQEAIAENLRATELVLHANSIVRRLDPTSPPTGADPASAPCLISTQ